MLHFYEDPAIANGQQIIRLIRSAVAVDDWPIEDRIKPISTDRVIAIQLHNCASRSPPSSAGKDPSCNDRH